MSLAGLLKPLLAFDGLLAVIVLTRDGLPVEMIGHGLRAEVLAAEIATVGESARTCFEALEMGLPERLKVDLPGQEVMLFRLGAHHYLGLVFQPSGNHALVSQIVEKTKPQLQAALGGPL
ncbi:MAG TPA: roadblock/LC7 domain-containing protein [Trueperaceae bacterium]